MTRRLTNAGIALLLIIALMGFLGVITGVRGDSRQSYSLTAAENESGVLTLSDETLHAGDSFTVTVQPAEGYRAAFVVADSLNSRTLTEPNRKKTVFTGVMPAHDVTLRGIFVPEDQYAVALLYNSLRGDCWTEPASAAAGTPVVLNTSVKEPYQVSRIASTPEDLAETMVAGENGARLFNMPESDVVLEIGMTRDAFEDVPDDAWYASYVYDIVDKGIMAGISSTQFQPEGQVTRAQAAQILYTMAGAPAVSTASSFNDVFPGQWHYNPITWCTSNGVMAGYSSGDFLPDAAITRQQMVSVLYKYTTKIRKDPASERDDLQFFADRDAVSSYAKTSMQWAVARGIISGTRENGQLYIQPQGVVSRAQMAIMLSSMLDESGGKTPVTPAPETPSPEVTESPSPAVTETPEPVDEGTDFKDVKSYSWYRSAADYCVAQNYMTADDGRFLPNKEVTRGQAAQMLYSLADRPAVSGQAPFTDISGGDYYSDAVTWCVQQDIAAGFADRTFRPDIPISRQQFIALLHRYTKFRGYKIEPSDNLNKFPDGGTVSDYAVIPMGWATHYSLIAGISGNLEPFGTLSRSQMACILQTYDKQIAGK